MHQLGPYQLVELLGQGGMGNIWLAEHVQDRRQVAIKTLRPELAGDRDAVRRFFAEAHAVNQIAHPNIVAISEFVEQPGGDVYLVMEALAGKDLETVATESGGHLGVRRTIGIMVQVCSALQAVHQAGIIHRDLKPANIFLIERNGLPDFAKVLDFGVAKLLDQDPGQSMSRGGVVGTPEYMAPEQAAGQRVGPAADVYSLGVILYRLTTGRLPIEGKNLGEIVVKLMTVTPPTPNRLNPEIPVKLSEVIMACLAKDPANRPPGVASLERLLATLAVDMEWDVVTHLVPPGTRLGAPSRRPLVRWPLVIGAVLLVVGGALAWLLSR